MTNDWILYAVLITAGVISFGWLLVAANRASKEERDWHRKLRDAARRCDTKQSRTRTAPSSHEPDDAKTNQPTAL